MMKNSFNHSLPLAVAILTLLLLTANSSFAGSSSWLSNPASGNWNTATNWTPATVPNGSSDVASFSLSNRKAVSISQATTVAQITFNQGASAFTISSSPGHNLDVRGAGIVNNSGITQNFVNNANATNRGQIRFFATATAGSTTMFMNNGRSVSLPGVSGGLCNFFNSSTADNGFFIQNGGTGIGGDGGRFAFNDTATAGSATFVNNGGVSGALAGGGGSFFGSSTAGDATFFNQGARVDGAPSGFTQLGDTATGDNATFTNNGGSVSGGAGGNTVFFASSTASNATLIANGGTSGGLGGGVYFADDSTGGFSRIELFDNGLLDISAHNSPGVTIGSIEGDGDVFLGANTLTVGSNNLSTVFSGVIQDGGSAGGAGGSLNKIGTGTLTLSNANTYTGSATISKGALVVKNTTGSATGLGAVQVNLGTLRGVGKIGGAVRVGNGSTSGAIILGGNNADSPGNLTINNALTFESKSTYKCTLKRSTSATGQVTGVAGKVTALGVTINTNVPFTFVDTGTGNLPAGAVLTVINNTSASPIAGRFSNLANGLIFTSNGNNFKVNYTGGTGNDLTLKVVP